MSSLQDINIKMAKLKAQYNMTKNEVTKLNILKQLEDLNKEAKALERNNKTGVKKPETKPVVNQEQPKKEEKKEEVVNDINRGKVVEPGNNTSDNKAEEKKEENRDNNNNKNNNNKNNRN